MDDKIMYIPRTLEAFLTKAAKQFPVILVTGARQVGKTTFLRHMCPANMTYLTLDDPLLLNLAKDDPALFFKKFPPPILIDEIQYAPMLLPYIKMLVDTEKKPSMFWLTGSQQFHLINGVSESLAGRVGMVNLLGFSRREVSEDSAMTQPFLPTLEIMQNRLGAESIIILQELYALIWRGSFPAMMLDNKIDRDLFYSSYVQTYLQRDIQALAHVGDSMAFLRFLRVTAARTGQLLNLAELARDASISPITAKQWLAILQASNIIYLLEPYYTNVTKRLVKTPKMYMLDTGLCAYLTEWSSAATLEAGAMSGAILETWVLTEILKSFWHNGLRAPFYYYRDKDQKEVDLLIVKDGIIYPLEFKKTASPNKKDVKHFQALGRLQMPLGSGGIICLVDQLIPLAENIMAIPVGVL